VALSTSSKKSRSTVVSASVQAKPHIVVASLVPQVFAIMLPVGTDAPWPVGQRLAPDDTLVEPTEFQIRVSWLVP
jgi:hypothetical protein